MQRLAIGPALVSWAPTGTDVSDLPDPPLNALDGERLSGFRPDRRRDFLLARRLVAGLVRELLPDAEPWTVGSRPCPRCGRPHAGVELAGVPVMASLAYADGLAVAAVAHTGRVARLGIDAEADAADPVRTQDLTRLLGRSREPVLRRWTRIEAVLKADGLGLAVDPGTVRFRGRTARVSSRLQPVLTGALSSRRTPGSPAATAGDASYRWTDVEAPSGYLISLAWCAPEPAAAASGPATR